MNMPAASAGSLLANLPNGSLADELFHILAEKGDARIERIVSTGQATPEGDWYDQETDEFVLLVSGAAALQIEGEAEERELGPGDWVMLPAHCRHRVAWTQSEPPTVWLAVHF
ncbi:Cupin domain protein [Methyloligella halotolerans]|uniref:Cupin domain protein n=1 Tax=Methyloligella halotolerans TaxID=1177755 RepID=A0A1E2RVM8_9HYPH|nr:cupin domain-containing protein [Methyloligella halotolerans]ODA66287.1 Cupin domain protein [Methyloligella halotolerans]